MPVGLHANLQRATQLLSLAAEKSFLLGSTSLRPTPSLIASEGSHCSLTVATIDRFGTIEDYDLPSGLDNRTGASLSKMRRGETSNDCNPCKG